MAGLTIVTLAVGDRTRRITVTGGSDVDELRALLAEGERGGSCVLAMLEDTLPRVYPPCELIARAPAPRSPC